MITKVYFVSERCFITPVKIYPGVFWLFQFIKNKSMSTKQQRMGRPNYMISVVTTEKKTACMYCANLVDLFCVLSHYV